MKRVTALFVAIAFTACSTQKYRTKYTDKTMRIMVDPQSVNYEEYVRLVQALMESGKWDVIDRAKGFQAMKSEQERLHVTEDDRYADEHKWALWGRMYGVGGIVIPNSQCQENRTAFWQRFYFHCLQTLSIVDANTGQVITSISRAQDGEPGEERITPQWDDTVEAFNKAFPAKFETRKPVQDLTDYMKQAKEEAEKTRQENHPVKKRKHRTYDEEPQQYKVPLVDREGNIWEDGKITGKMPVPIGGE